MSLHKRNSRFFFQNWVNLRKHKMAIKKRLIEISIRVDGYIYRNKPITVEDADKYLAEIAIHRTRNNDVHILQVIEKLTRCLKTIIEETKKKLPPKQEVATSVNDQSINLLHSMTNKYEDSNIILDYGNIRETTETVSKSKDPDSNIAVVIISDSEDEEKRDEYNAQHSPRISTHCIKPNIKEAVSLKDLTTQYAQSNNLNNVNSNHLHPDESHCDQRTDKTKEAVNNNGYLIVTKSKKPRQYKKKDNKNVENSQQTLTRPMYQLETNNTKNKKKSGVPRKPLQCGKPLNLETTVKTTPKELKVVPKKTQNRAPKKKTNKDLRDTTNKRKNSSKKKYNIINDKPISKFKEHNTSPSLLAPLICTPIKHKHIDICDEVSLPVPITSNDAVSNTTSNDNSVANKIGAFTIYNERAVDDVSWVEDIRYVREINANEFDPTLNKINETFWKDLSLPYEWKNNDFL